MKRSLVLCLSLVACGGGDDPPADSAPAGDAPPPTVMSVTCDGTEVEEIQTMNFAFTPNNATITAGQVIKFVTESNHNVIPTGANADSGFKVGFGSTTCLKFTAAGSFGYRCQPHSSMTGTITVN